MTSNVIELAKRDSWDLRSAAKAEGDWKKARRCLDRSTGEFTTLAGWEWAWTTVKLNMAWIESTPQHQTAHYATVSCSGDRNRGLLSSSPRTGHAHDATLSLRHGRGRAAGGWQRAVAKDGHDFVGTVHACLGFDINQQLESQPAGLVISLLEQP